MQPPVKISIVTACRNEHKHINAFLDSVLAQDWTGLDVEVLIADGMSTDGTRDLLAAYSANHPRVRILDNPGRIVSTGLNAAIRAARGEVILRMDAHTIYDRSYCRTCVNELLRTGADNVGGPARTQARGPVANAIAAAYHSRFSTGGAHFHNPDFEGWADTVPYGCWRRETLLQLGLFDEQLVRNQDDELNLRLLRSGGKIWQSPAIISWYSPRSAISTLFHQYFQYGFWKVAVIRKHRIPGSWRHLVPAGFVACHLVLIAAGLALMAFDADSAFAVAQVWFAITATYSLASLFSSILAAKKSSWQTLPYLPAVFAAYHFSYGLGFLAGLFRFSGRDASVRTSESVFAKLSR